MPGRAWPEDIKPQWFNVIRRLQSIARNDNEGLAVLRIEVLVDKEGVPVIWTSPKKTLLEPKRLGEHLLEILTAAEG